MASLTTPSGNSTLPVTGADMDAEPITGWINAIKNWTNDAGNIDESNVDLSGTDGIMGKSTAQTITGLKTFSNTGAAAQGVLTAAHFAINPATGTATDGDGVNILFKADDDGGTAVNIGQIDVVFTDTAAASKDSEFVFKTFVGNTASEVFSVGDQGTFFNEDSNDLDFRIEGSTNANLFLLDAGQDALSIGGANVDGAALTLNNLTDRTAVTSVGTQLHIPAQTQNFDNANGTIAIGASHFIGIPTQTGDNASLTMTNAATLYIQGAPVASTNVVHTNTAYSLWVDAGATQLDGNVAIGGTLGVTGIATHGAAIVSDTDNTDDLGTSSVRWANLHVVSIGDAGNALALTAGANALTLTGAIDITGTADVSGNFSVATNKLTVASATGNTVIAGTTTHGGNVVSDTDGTDDLGTTGVRWANIFVDAATITNNATIGGTLGVTGALTATGGVDGVLGGVTPAAATVTTLNTSGAVVFNEASADVDFRVESNGNANMLFVDGGEDRVGVGTNAPATQVEVVDAGTNSETILTFSTYNDQVGYRPQIAFRKSHNDTQGSLTATIDTEELGLIRFVGVDNTSAFDDGARILAIQDGAAGAKIPTNLILSTWSATAENSNQLVLHNDGNVGIGTATPDTKLHLWEANSGATTRGGALLVLESDANENQIEFQNANTSAAAGIFWTDSDAADRAQLYYDHAADKMYIASGGSTTMVMDGSQNVGIGTASPGALLSINSTIAGGSIGDSFQQEIVNTNITAGDYFGTIYRYAANNANTDQAFIGAVVTSGASNGLSDIVFATKASNAVTSVTEYMRIQGGGNVGIGTAAPAYKLHLYGTAAADVSQRIQVNNATGDPSLIWTTDATNWYAGVDNSDSDKFKIGDDTAVGTGTVMTMTTGGSVGIGTASPSRKLDIATGYLNFTDDYGILWGGNTNLQILGNSSTDALSFVTNTTTRMTLDSSGNLGLGKTPEAWDAGYDAMQIGGTMGLMANSTEGAGSDNYIFQNLYFDGAFKRFVNDEAGYLQFVNGTMVFASIGAGAADTGITPTAKLTIVTDGRLTNYSDAAGGYAGAFQNDGNNANRNGISITGGADDASGTTVYVGCFDGDGGAVGSLQNINDTFQLVDGSDERLKENIIPTQTEGIESLRQIEVIDFDRKKSGSHSVAGFSAQQLATLYPNAVAKLDPTDEDPESMLGVAKTELIGPIVKSVQELDGTMQTFMGRDLERSQEIDGLQAQIEALTEEVAALRNQKAA